MSRLHLTRRAVPLALAIGAALASPAAANHGPCEAMGGLTLTGVGPTNATVCVYVGANGVAAGTDVVHECDSTCTLAGAHAEYTGTGAHLCLVGIYEGTWIVSRCI